MAAAKLALAAALFGAVVGLSGCGGGGGGAPPPPPPPPPPATLFNDVTAAAGIEFTHGFGLPSGVPNGPQADVASSTFGGVASGDCDNDGDIDLFVTYSDERPNRLYLNQQVETGGLAFADTAATAGVDFTEVAGQNGRHSGPVFVDLDGDGDLDLFLGALYGDPVKIYRNDGSCSFTDVTADSPELVNMLADYTFSAGFGDYDLDGDIDMFLSHWGTPDSVYSGIEGGRTGFSEHLWENRFDSTGNIEFQNASQTSGVAAITHEPRSWGTAGARCPRFVQAGFEFHDFVFTGTFAHLNDDIWPDLLIVGDFKTSQILINNGDGTFSDASPDSICDAQQPMGSALGDYDDDGDLDWFTTSIKGEGAQDFSIGNRFYENDGVAGGLLALSDITDAMGVASGGWGWGACFLDIDNDRDLDIFHTNGWYIGPPTFVADYRVDPSRVFIFDGSSFSEQGSTFGLNDTLSGRGVVCADFDDDGDVDIFQTTNRLPNSGLLRENRMAADGNNYLKVRLAGLAPNTGAIGARIYLTIGTQTQMREIMVGSDNYTSQNPAVQHFGLGTESVVDEIRVVWPAREGGTVQSADTVLSAADISLNTTLDIAETP